jgi:hypothetical protein
MGIMNRRNALIGWLVLRVARRRVSQKAAEVVPIETRSARVNGRVAAMVAAGSALVVGIVLYVRRRASRPAQALPSEPAAPPESPPDPLPAPDTE